ncbi:MAG TPA: LUD domain-containing protein [Mycobacteriales bacterium]|nr:LUD domain-containing protein [Mycobacteriales bacterium]
MSARDEILGRIRSALADVPAAESVAVPRDYRTRLDVGSTVDLFTETVADYKATVRSAAAGEVGPAVRSILAERGISRVGVPSDLPVEWRPEGAVPDTGLTTAELDRLDGAVTGAALGIALTGTIVLDGGPRQGRRALTLVPDYHLCIVQSAQIVGSLPEAMSRLSPDRPLTFISGPSATSDIELNRVEGVHGPRTLDVLIVPS